MLDKGACLRFYKRREIQEAIIAHARNKEIGFRFGDGFGKRPDLLAYPQEIIELAKQGVTSFHASEECWENPLDLNSNLGRKELDRLRIAWDLVLDLDCKLIEYSKIAADLIIKFLKYCGVKDYSCKFSVTGDTPLLVKINGETRLLSIEETIYQLKQNKSGEILSLDKQGNVCFSKITEHLKHKEKTYNLFYDNSRLPIKATRHHSVFVWENSKIIQKEVSKLKPGDSLITFRKADKIPRKAGYFEWSYSFLRKTKSNKVKISKEVMLLLGYYLAEGHLTKIIYQIGFSFNSNEEEYIKECISLLTKITQKKVSIRHPNKNTTQILVHSKEWYSFFEKACGKGAKNKHVPLFSWELPTDYFEQMMLGYIRGDSYKQGKYSVTAKSVSHQLIKELTWLCQLNGIPCSINQEKNVGHYLPQGLYFKGSHVYTLNIAKSELPFSEFLIPRNKFSPYPRCKTFPVDGLKEVYKQIKPKLFNHHRPEQMTLRKKSANLTRIKNVLDWFENYKSVEYSKESKQIITNYNKLFNNDLMTVEVKEIITGKKEMVYDVSVEETERFFGGSFPILLHNSGNKGFHLGIPFEAFPKTIGPLFTKDLFPEAAKEIAFYIKENIKEELGKRILEFENNNFSQIIEKVGLPQEKIIRYEQNQFGDKIAKLDVDKFLEIDTVLISSRHLYRMPYSLHEKSGLVSLPIDPDKVIEFKKEMAHPDAILAPRFVFLDRKVTEESARRLLVRALDFKAEIKESKNQEHEKKVWNENEEIKIECPIKEEFFPPCMLNYLNGLEDGKKRAAFCLMNFLGKIGWSKTEIEGYLQNWNREKNREPLREVYLKGQMNTFQPGEKLPPNCGNEAYYPGLGLCKPDALCRKIKNPVNYTILKWKSHLRDKEEEESQGKRKKKEKIKIPITPTAPKLPKPAQKI